LMGKRTHWKGERNSKKKKRVSGEEGRLRGGPSKKKTNGSKESRPNTVPFPGGKPVWNKEVKGKPGTEKNRYS